MFAPGRCCRTSGPGVRRRGGTTTTGAARRSGSTPTATTTTGSTTSRSPPRWVVTAGDSPRPKLRDGQAFFGDVLEHLPVEEQLGDQEPEARDLGLEFVDATGVIDLGGVVALPPTVVGVL